MGLPGEVLVVDVLRHRHLGDVELCRGGHQVPLVHPPVLKQFDLCAATSVDSSSLTVRISRFGTDDGCFQKMKSTGKII